MAYDRLTCKTCDIAYACEKGSTPGTYECLKYKRDIAEGCTTEKFFLCEDCLNETNVGKYYTEHGVCVRCGNKNDGNFVTLEDIKNSDKLGLDSAGVDWHGVLPAYNVAYPGTVCPVCGYSGISRIKREHMNNGSSSGPARYKCNDCGVGLRIINRGHEPVINTEDELKQWIDRHKIILRVGNMWRARNKSVRLCANGKTVFFMDRGYEVVGKMLTASTCKTRDIAVSKVVVDKMLDGFRDECRWRVR